MGSSPHWAEYTQGKGWEAYPLSLFSYPPGTAVGFTVDWVKLARGPGGRVYDEGAGGGVSGLARYHG